MTLTIVASTICLRSSSTFSAISFFSTDFVSLGYATGTLILNKLFLKVLFKVNESFEASSLLLGDFANMLTFEIKGIKWNFKSERGI